MKLVRQTLVHVTGWADRSWCRLVQSSVGDQVLGVYEAHPVLADHMAGCSACRGVADEYAQLATGLGELQQRSYLAPPDFVDQVIDRLDAPVSRSRRTFSVREKMALVAAAALGAIGLAVAGILRRARVGP